MRGMVTNAQVRRLMKLREQKRTLAAAAAGMDEKTARKHGSGADRIAGAIRPGVRRGDAAYAAMP